MTVLNPADHQRQKEAKDVKGYLLAAGIASMVFHGGLFFFWLEQSRQSTLPPPPPTVDDVMMVEAITLTMVPPPAQIEPNSLDLDRSAPSERASSERSEGAALLLDTLSPMLSPSASSGEPLSMDKPGASTDADRPLEKPRPELPSLISAAQVSAAQGADESDRGTQPASDLELALPNTTSTHDRPASLLASELAATPPGGSTPTAPPPQPLGNGLSGMTLSWPFQAQQQGWLIHRAGDRLINLGSLVPGSRTGSSGAGNSSSSGTTSRHGAGNARSTSTSTTQPQDRSRGQAVCIECPRPTFQGSEGTARVVFDVDPAGRPTNIRLVQSSGNAQTDLATLEAMRKRRYSQSDHGLQGVRVRVNFAEAGSAFHRQLQQQPSNRQEPDPPSQPPANPQRPTSSNNADNADQDNTIPDDPIPNNTAQPPQPRNAAPSPTPAPSATPPVATPNPPAQPEPDTPLPPVSEAPIESAAPVEPTPIPAPISEEDQQP